LKFNRYRQERRKYRRLDTVFPVEFQVLDIGLKPLSEWRQAFSQDISLSGICLTANILSETKPINLDPDKSRVLLQIHSPFSRKTFLAYTNIIWIRKIEKVPFLKYKIGLSFFKVDAKELRKIVIYSYCKEILWRMLQISVVCILVSSIFLFIKYTQLRSDNIKLLRQFSQVLQRDENLNRSINKLYQQQNHISKSLNEYKTEGDILRQRIQSVSMERADEIMQLEQAIKSIMDLQLKSESDLLESQRIQEELNEIKESRQKKIDGLERELSLLKEKQDNLEKDLVEIPSVQQRLKDESYFIQKENDLMAREIKAYFYRWLASHQNQRTGLIVSFEGDSSLQNVSFIYDQSLSVIAFTYFRDYERAKKNLNFFLSSVKRSEGGFANAYYASTGEIAENMSHAGPNLWLGLAILHYTYSTGDQKYMDLAKQIADWIITLQDDEGGVKGGNTISWYSTEHNLDGFAFFDMMHTLTGDSRYKITRDRIFEWLRKYAYSNINASINRGKGDSTIATDTYAWSIAALGPERLKDIGMKPDEILEFAEQNCLVAVEFTNYLEKETKVTGFDFAKYKHLPRGGVISCEWTAQMILAYKIIAEYQRKNNSFVMATMYGEKADKYLQELSKMVIVSLSPFGQGRWCLPYASEENVDTGHGWRTPKGKRTGSVAATAYGIFAISGYNPLRLDG